MSAIYNWKTLSATYNWKTLSATYNWKTLSATYNWKTLSWHIFSNFLNNIRKYQFSHKKTCIAWEKCLENRS